MAWHYTFCLPLCLHIYLEYNFIINSSLLPLFIILMSVYPYNLMITTAWCRPNRSYRPVVENMATSQPFFLWNLVWLVWFMVFNDTFNNISAISWRSVLLVEETGVLGENLRPTCLKSLSNFITYCWMEYTSPCTGFELTTLCYSNVMYTFNP